MRRDPQGSLSTAAGSPSRWSGRRVGTGLAAAFGLAAVLPAGEALGQTGIRVVHGDRRSTEISSATDTDQFLFEALAGTRLSVVVKATDGGLEPLLAVADPNGSPVSLGASLVLGDGIAKIRSVELPGTETYTITVSGASGSTGAYTLRVTAVAPSGTTSRVTLNNDAVVDRPFTGFEGGSITSTVKLVEGPLPPRPELRDPSGALVPDSDASFRSSRSGWTGRRTRLSSGNGTYNLRLRGPNRNGPSVVDVTLKPGLAPDKPTRIRIPVLEPSVSDFTPKNNLVPGQAVTVSGANFSPMARAFLFRGLEDPPLLPATVTAVAVDGSGLVFQVPAGATGTYQVIVCNPEGQASTAAQSLGVNAGTPGSDGVDPSTGPAAGGTLVTILGSGFVNGITVSIFDGTSTLPMAVTFVDSSTLEFTTPAHAPGTVDLLLQNPGGPVVVRSAAFTFTDESESGTFADVSSDLLPAVPQSGDFLAASRGAIVDLNRDGRMDLVLQSANILPGGASLRILRQTATGEFLDETHGSIPDRFGGFQSPVDLGEGPGFAIGDLDGDLFPDIVVSGQYIAKSISPGSLDYIVDRDQSGSEFGFGYKCGTSGDFDIFWNEHYSATRIFKNDGNGNFFSSPVGGTNSKRRIPAVGFYADAAAQQDAADRSFLDTKYVYYGVYFYQTRYRGDAGFVIAGGPSSGPAFPFPVMNPFYAPPVSTTIATGGERFQGDAVAIGDLDGDGTSDLVVGLNGPVYQTAQVKFLRASGFKPGYYFVNTQRPSTRVLLNTKAGNTATGVFKDNANPLLDPTQFAFPDTGYADYGQAVDIAVADIDLDGDQDLVLAAPTRFTLFNPRSGSTEYRPGTRVFVNRGGSSARFDDATRSNMPTVDVGPPSLAAPDFFEADRVLLGDLDGDGDPDMVLSSAAPAFVSAGRPFTRILRNRNDGAGLSTGIFDDITDSAMPAIAAPEYWQANSLALHDIDGDGDLDLLLSTSDAAVTAVKPGTRVLLNDGTGVFSTTAPGITTETFIPAQGGSELWAGDLVLVGDLDGDGRADIVISEEDPLNPAATRILKRK